MRLLNYIDEEEYINRVTSWFYQSQVYKFESLNEIFDKDVKITDGKPNKSEFKTHFNIDGIEYTFEAKLVNTKNTDYNGMDIWSIYFYSDFGPDMFMSKGNKKYVGEVFAGVFRSLEKLNKNKNVDGIIFSTEDAKLRSLYKRMAFWVSKRFQNFIFQKHINNDHKYEFLFLKKGVNKNET